MIQIPVSSPYVRLGSFSRGDTHTMALGIVGQILSDLCSHRWSCAGYQQDTRPWSLEKPLDKRPCPANPPFAISPGQQNVSFCSSGWTCPPWMCDSSGHICFSPTLTFPLLCGREQGLEVCVHMWGVGYRFVQSQGALLHLKEDLAGKAGVLWTPDPASVRPWSQVPVQGSSSMERETEPLLQCCEVCG